MTKQVTSYRLSLLTLNQINTLSEHTGQSKANVIQTAIDRMYREEIKDMSTYYITNAMLGDQATADDARRLVALLAQRGYDVAYGNPRRDQRDEEIRQADWNDCLDILSREKYGKPAE